MSRRNLIPFAVLAVLAVLTAAVAVVGATSAPSGATLTVQNASGRTFGSPTGSTSFAMEVVSSLSGGAGPGPSALQRLIDYAPPDRMTVYQVGSKTKPLGVLDEAAITCALSTYTAIVGGGTPWTPGGSGSDTYTRTESLAEYSARVPRPVGSSCEPVASSARGQVGEKAVVRAGYLVGVRLTVNVPLQSPGNGRPAVHGVEEEALVLLEIGGTATRSLGR